MIDVNDVRAAAARIGGRIRHTPVLRADSGDGTPVWFKLEYTQSDDQGAPATAPSAAQKLIDDSKVVAVVGPVFSGATRAAEPKFSDANLATVSPSATAPDLTKHGWKNFARIVVDDNTQGPADADYIAKVLKLHSVYVIDDASGYAQPLAAAFISKAKSDSLTVKHDTATGTTQCQAGNGPDCLTSWYRSMPSMYSITKKSFLPTRLAS